jgi:hypothetical protein
MSAVHNINVQLSRNGAERIYPEPRRMTSAVKSGMSYLGDDDAHSPGGSPRRIDPEEDAAFPAEERIKGDDYIEDSSSQGS